LGKKLDDQKIIEAFRTGNDHETLKILYKRCFPKIKAYICSNSGSGEDALDIFQDAVLALCKQIKMGKYNEKYDIDGFIYSVSRNMWINKAKKNKRQVAYIDEYEKGSEENDYIDFIVTPEREKMVKSILSKLGEKCVELLQYSIFYRMSNREICEKMPFASENAVKTQKYKCKQKLLSIMEAYPVVKELID